MVTPFWMLRPLAMGLSALLVVAVPSLLASPQTPADAAAKPADSAKAEKTELLRQAPFDRITLIDGKVLTIDPISPRPMPPPPVADTSKKAKILTKQEQQEVYEAERLIIRLTEGDFRDFVVKKVSIKSIEYFEDLLLAEGDRLVREGNYPKAFEYYLAVRERAPQWTGLDERINKLLFEEGSAAVIRQEPEFGLRLQRELLARQPEYPGLLDRLARAYSERITRAIDRGLFAEGRQALRDLESITPGHVLAKDARNKFIGKAQALVDRSARREGGDKLQDLSEALRIWPDLNSAASQFESTFLTQPTLDVGVLDIPYDRNPGNSKTPGFGPWIRTQAEDRVSRLVYLPILARDDEEATRGDLPDQLVSEMEITDIGRTVHLRLKREVTWSDGSRPISSLDVSRTLGDRALPGSPSYSARWANMLDRLEAPDDERVTIRLSRPIFKPEAWLVTPIGPAHAGRDGLVATPEGRVTVGDGPFRVAEFTKGTVRFRAATEPPSDSRRIRFVREIRTPSAGAAVAALMRGEVALLEHAPPDRVPELAKVEGIKVGSYLHPSLHRIAIDGRTPALRNRSIRRGLSFAIDRKTLLEETVLKRPPDDKNRVADGPFPVDSYANSEDVRPFDYDPLMAKMLIAAGRKELGGEAIRLRFEYPAIPEAQAAAPKIAEMLRNAGKVGNTVSLSIDLVERAPSDLELDLRSGKPFDLVYVADRVSEPVIDAGRILCPGYDAPPDTDALTSVASPRILQVLLQLERVGDAASAREILQQIDRECRDELPILPLWQLEDHYAWRVRLTGPRETAETLYEGIATWEIEPWFARDPWSSSSSSPSP